jgi:hypothetical protein
MADSTNTTALLIGGGLALAGTVVSQVFGLFSGWLDRRHKRRVIHRERLEELTDCVAKTLLWFPKLSAGRTISDIQEAQPPTEARRMVCLAILYFPQLKNAVADYSNGLAKFYHWTTDCFNPMAPASAGAQAAMSPDCEQRNKEITMLRQKLDNEIEKEARRYMSV